MYDFEKELAELILQGKCGFETKELKHFIFWGEGSPEILTKFVIKYEQKNINEKEKEKIMNFIKKNYIQGKSMKDLYESFMDLFFYLSEDKSKLNNGIILEDLLKLIPPDLNLSKDFNEFIDEIKNFKLNQIFEVFLYLEHLYFELLIYNNNYKNDFNRDIHNIDEIITKLKEFEFIDELIKALRRYITRYLITNKNSSLNLYDNLINQFKNPDLWGIEQMKKFDEIKNKLNTDLKNLNINIGQSITLYEAIGQKDKEIFKEFIKEIRMENENLNDIHNTDTNLED